MFDYLKLASLMKIMCDKSTIRYATPLRIPQNVNEYLEDNNIEPRGFLRFYDEKDGNIRIYIVYGICDYAMLHDIIDDKYTFCIFPDFILRDERTYIEIYTYLYKIFKYILKYAYPLSPEEQSPEVKDTFLDSIDQQIKNLAAYNVWTAEGDKFLDKYKEVYPEETKIEKIMNIIDRIGNK